MTDALALRRDPVQAQIAGVCAGLAHKWGWTPRSVRVLFVVASILTGGYGVGVYLAAWALIPRQGQSVEPIRSSLPFTRSWSRSTLIIVVVVLLFLVLGISGAGPSALVIMGIVWWIMQRSRRPQPQHTPPPPPAPTTEFERMSVVWQQRLANVEAGLPPDWEATPTPTPAPAPATIGPDPSRSAAGRRRGTRTWLWILVGLGLVWTASYPLGRLVGATNGLMWSAVTLAVLGIALILVSRPSRAVYGRPRGLIFLTVLMSLITAFGVLVTQATPSVPGDTVHLLVTSSTPTDEPDLGVGDTLVDLSTVEVTQDWAVAYTMDIGRLTVEVPDTGNVRVVSAVDLGQVSTPADKEGGFDVNTVWERIDDDGPVLTITTELGLGETEVTP